MVLILMNLISMVLFGTQTRYWYTLLPAVLANLELYPGWAIRLHVSQDVFSHPISDLLPKLSDALPERFQVYSYGDPYTDQEPSMWRMRPLWDTGIERFLCRDVDSVPSTAEIQAVRIWLRMPHPVQSIRSYHLHITLLMAGLCGFNNPALQPLRDAVPSFETYVELYKKHATQCPNFMWGCDQEMLKMMFGSVAGSAVLDFPIGDCPYHEHGVNHVKKEVTYAENLFDLPKGMLGICDEITKIPWGEFEGFAGRPHGDFRPYLARMLDLPLETCRTVKQVLQDNPSIKKFYEPDNSIV